MSDTVTEGLTHYFEDFGLRVHHLADQLSEDQFWHNPYPYGNSVGNLVLHLIGNLSYYIGTEIAGTGYVRDRDLEFSTTQTRDKEDVLTRLDETIRMVVGTLEQQGEEDWSRAYQAMGVDDVHDRFGIYLRCAVHFHHHIGQMIYLVKELSATPRGADAAASG